VNTSSPSARATARAVAVCAVLTGLFFMHGLATQKCHGGAGTSASSMTHPMATMPAAASGIVKPVKAMAHASLNSSSAHVTSTNGADASRSGGLCVSTPPTLDLARLLALLLAIGVLVPASDVARLNLVTHSRKHRPRAPPLAGSALLINLCVCRT
jgi:hypothetical protein